MKVDSFHTLSRTEEDTAVVIGSTHMSMRAPVFMNVPVTLLI